MARYALNLPAELKKEAEQLAERQGISLNQFILWSVAEKVGALRRGLDDPDFPNISYRRSAAGLFTPVLKGTGIRVQTIAVAAHHWGLPNAQIAAEHGLSEQQVKDALAFYDIHRSEIDANLMVEESQAGILRQNL